MVENDKYYLLWLLTCSIKSREIGRGWSVCERWECMGLCKQQKTSLAPSRGSLLHLPLHSGLYAQEGWCSLPWTARVILELSGSWTEWNHYTDRQSHYNLPHLLQFNMDSMNYPAVCQALLWQRRRGDSAKQIQRKMGTKANGHCSSAKHKEWTEMLLCAVEQSHHVMPGNAKNLSFIHSQQPPVKAETIWQHYRKNTQTSLQKFRRSLGLQITSKIPQTIYLQCSLIYVGSYFWHTLHSRYYQS